MPKKVDLPIARWQDGAWHFYKMPEGAEVETPPKVDPAKMPRPEYLPGERIRFKWDVPAQLTGEIRQIQLNPRYSDMIWLGLTPLEAWYYKARLEYTVYTPHARNVYPENIIGRV